MLAVLLLRGGRQSRHPGSAWSDRAPGPNRNVLNHVGTLCLIAGVVNFDHMVKIMAHVFSIVKLLFFPWAIRLL